MPLHQTLPDPYHYAIIARAIETIAERRAERLSLAEVAAAAGLSPAHFQRVFSRWAGVSPKRYQQYLALDHARRLLADRHTVLSAAHEAGLSGSGRLHDLFLRWEAMSPGDFARAGAGLTIFWGWFGSPFGPALVMGTEKGICGIAFAAECGAAAAMEDLLGRWPEADFVEDPTELRPWVLAAFGTDGRHEAPPVVLIGAPLQIKVWEALLRVPSGHVTTYGDIAAAIGSPRAARAVGTAVGRNPVAWLIPCHRVLRKAGGLGGYHWGVGVKRAMLAWEAARLDSASPPG